MSRRAERWITPLILLVLTAGYVYVFRDVFVTHRFMLTRDSVANFPPYQFAFSAVRNGELPLWSAEMNAGEPLWPIAELHPSYEPIPLLTFAIATGIGATGITAFSFVLLVWLLGYAFGGWLFARNVGLSPIAQIFVFTVLLWSSLGILMLYQGQYLVIARWVPLAMATGWWFLQHPGVARAALLGVVVGLALPGYQTPYLALFTIVLACAGGRKTLAALDRVPRYALGVAILFTLAILLPTVTAGAEWLGMVPVARVAWPQGTRAVLLPDVLAPLLGQLRSESALYVGVVPLLLALIAVGAAVRNQDSRARFWAWTTAGTMLVFLGIPEMITGRDQPFLFVRDWSFVLPLCVLSVTMLGGVGLDRVRSLVPSRWSRSVAFILAGLVFLDLSFFASTHYRRVAVPRTRELQAREPAPVRPVVGFSMFRNKEFDISAYAPFHKQGPAVWGIPSAYLDPEPFAPPYRPLVALGQFYTHGSHYLRLPRYEAVLSTLSRPAFDCIAGVACPIARLVEAGVSVPDFGAALATLARLPLEHLNDVIVIEEDGGGEPARRADSAVAGRATGPVGTLSVLCYRADRMELDVLMHRPGFLYYADGYAPEWRASVNGASAPVLPANGAFKAIRLASGSHRVVLTYRPWRYVVAVAIRIAGIIGGILVFLLARPSKRIGSGAPMESP
jgi:hypothetical protein